jgi:hypothetical protein
MPPIVVREREIRIGPDFIDTVARFLNRKEP